MASYNYSSNKYTVGKNQGQEWINLKINNIGDGSRTFTIKAFDADSNEALTLYSEDKETAQETVEPNGSVILKINAEKAENRIALELSHNGRGSGITVRQQSSSNNRDEGGIELNLR